VRLVQPPLGDVEAASSTGLPIVAISQRTTISAFAVGRVTIRYRFILQILYKEDSGGGDSGMNRTTGRLDNASPR
jgi:hypothetical protein